MILKIVVIFISMSLIFLRFIFHQHQSYQAKWTGHRAQGKGENYRKNYTISITIEFEVSGIGEHSNFR